jgi:adenine-specific DNA-methyltransferase
MGYNTKHVMDKYNISKPTINSWIKKGLISEPERDWRGWRIWNEENIRQIGEVIMEKQSQYCVGSDIEDDKE